MDLSTLPGYRLAIQGQYEERFRDATPESERARHEALAPYIERVVALLDLPDEGALLDLGCGSGALGIAVARARPRSLVTGIDASARAVALAWRCGGPENVGFLVADAEAPPGGPYDRLSALSLFNLMPDKRAALAAWRRVAAKGARLVLTDAFATKAEPTGGSGATTHDGLAQLARATGWRVSRREDLTPLVTKLTAAGVWAWPEYVRDGYRYGGVALDAV